MCAGSWLQLPAGVRRTKWTLTGASWLDTPPPRTGAFEWSSPRIHLLSRSGPVAAVQAAGPAVARAVVADAAAQAAEPEAVGAAAPVAPVALVVPVAPVAKAARAEPEPVAPAAREERAGLADITMLTRIR